MFESSGHNHHQVKLIVRCISIHTLSQINSDFVGYISWLLEKSTVYSNIDILLYVKQVKASYVNIKMTILQGRFNDVILKIVNKCLNRYVSKKYIFVIYSTCFIIGLVKSCWNKHLKYHEVHFLQFSVCLSSITNLNTPWKALFYKSQVLLTMSWFIWKSLTYVREFHRSSLFVFWKACSFK